MKFAFIHGEGVVSGPCIVHDVGPIAERILRVGEATDASTREERCATRGRRRRHAQTGSTHLRESSRASGSSRTRNTRWEEARGAADNREVSEWSRPKRHGKWRRGGLRRRHHVHADIETDDQIELGASQHATLPSVPRDHWNQLSKPLESFVSCWVCLTLRKADSAISATPFPCTLHPLLTLPAARPDRQTNLIPAPK